MIVVALTGLAAWRYELRRRSAEFAAAMKRRSQEFASRADQHNDFINNQYFELYMFNGLHAPPVLPIVPDLTELLRDSERGLRYLEDFYGYGLTESDMAERGLTESVQARQMLRLLWLRYELHLYFKYRRAATRPWLPVDTDPPEPPLGPYPPPGEEWWKDGRLQMTIDEYSKFLPHSSPE